MRLMLIAICAALAASALPSFASLRAREGFGSETRDGAPQGWVSDRGLWQQERGAVFGESRERAAYANLLMGTLWEGEISAALTMEKRVHPGYAYAGLALYQDPSDFWQLALVESPAGERYVELLENYLGRWQAQSLLGTKLDRSLDEGTGEWEYGRPYVLTIRLSNQTIEGLVTDAADGRSLRHIAYRFDPSTPTVAQGRAALLVAAARAKFESFSSRGEEMTVGDWIAQRPPEPRAAIVVPNPQDHQSLTSRLTALLDDAGFHVDSLSWSDVAAQNWGETNPYSLVLLLDADRFPYRGLVNLQQYLKRGGNLLVLGAPPFRELLIESRGRWLNWQEALADTEPETLVLDFARERLSDWSRASATPEVEAHTELTPDEAVGEALSVTLPEVEQWDTVARGGLEGAVPQGHDLACFWAKGDDNTPQIVVEWQETDGSRWIATVDLDTDWRHYALPVEAFKYWLDSPAKGRGGDGDYLRLDNVSLFSVGIARSHSRVPDGPHSYAIAQVGTAPAPFSTVNLEPPLLESLSPKHKTFALGPLTNLTVAGHNHPVAQPLEGWATVERSKGLGTAPGRAGRLKVYARAANDPGGEGVVAWRFLSTSPPYEGASWGAILILDDQGRPALPDELAPALQRMAADVLEGPTLIHAGAPEFSYAYRDNVPLAARIANWGASDADLTLRVEVAREGDASPAYAAEASLHLPTGQTAERQFEWRPAAPGFYFLNVSLLRSAGLADRIRQPLTILGPEHRTGDFVRVHDGDFWLGDHRWHPVGLNFWPRYVAGQERTDYWLHWLELAQYDPEVVEKDLAVLESLNVNAVSIQAGNPNCLHSLNDFLARARRRGIRANLFLPGAHPLYFDPELVRAIIQGGALASNPALFAYDVAWEPRWGKHDERRPWDAEWVMWIEERYGSLDNAERDWAFPCPRENGQLTNPLDDQILNDGPWRTMVAAYRRFLDDFLSQRLNVVCSFIRSLDPNHLISFRAGYGGTGQQGVDVVMPFDLVAGAKHLDFISPEAWGWWGDWERIRDAGLTTAYAKWASDGKPVFWAEFGFNIYPAYRPEDVALQEETYQSIFRMVAESGASGGAGWWYPGGLRVDENSDFGVVNPDGTPRPAALALAHWARALAQAEPSSAQQTPIIFDRDLHPRGFSQVRRRALDAYLSALDAGSRPVLRTIAAGTTSADTPLLAVGDTRCDGSNPPKFLNAEFSQVLLRVDDGDWREVAKGEALQAPGAISLSATIGNTGEAAWLAPKPSIPQRGSVYLVAEQAGDILTRVPLARDVPRFGDAQFTLDLSPDQLRPGPLTLYLEASERTPFGEKFSLTLAPPN